MSEKKTYLITTTLAETPQLWLAQTDSLQALLLRASRQGGGMSKVTIFHLGLDAVQPNNCLEAKLLEQLAVVPPRDFQLWLDELLRRATIGRSKKDSAQHLLAVLTQTKAKLDTLMKEDKTNVSEIRSGEEGSSSGTESTAPQV